MDKAADERFANAYDELDSFNRLHDPNHAWQNAQHATFCTAWNHPWWWRFGVEAAIAGTAEMRGKNRALAVEAEDRAVDVRLLQKNTDVIAQVACGEIVRAVDHDVIGFDDLAGVLGLEEGVVQVDLHIRVDFFDAVAGAVEFLAAYILRSMQNLALEVRVVHDIEIHKPERADACGSQIKGDRRAKSAGADAKNLRRFEAFLALHGDLGHDEMPRVACHLVVAKVDFLHTGRIQNAFHVV